MKKVTRSKTDRMLTGALGGISEYLGIDSRIVRIIFAILTIYPGHILFGLLAYVIIVVLIPNDQKVTSSFEDMFNRSQQYTNREEKKDNKSNRKNLKDVQEFDHKK
ncbi:PspC domain-containing protein [Apilactobacillus apisilvae]|uniref:PspC domain-containing protein n=1 Tax=Apilactobacillus apisilvae TaxID=2923364 RepID=A0ABY4PGY8_9LACO|nr:PspC domain-containing protein [Apilactobacillus apisilvae]UQS85076.1 PspC domain-containing protein [Apilactobacillus apisilvae]